MSRSNSDLKPKEENIAILEAYRKARAELQEIPLEKLFQDLKDNKEASDSLLEMRLQMDLEKDKEWLDKTVKTLEQAEEKEEALSNADLLFLGIVHSVRFRQEYENLSLHDWQNFWDRPEESKESQKALAYLGKIAKSPVPDPRGLYYFGSLPSGQVGTDLLDKAIKLGNLKAKLSRPPEKYEARQDLLREAKQDPIALSYLDYKLGTALGYRTALADFVGSLLMKEKNLDLSAACLGLRQLVQEIGGKSRLAGDLYRESSNRTPIFTEGVFYGAIFLYNSKAYHGSPGSPNAQHYLEVPANTSLLELMDHYLADNDATVCDLLLNEDWNLVEAALNNKDIATAVLKKIITENYNKDIPWINQLIYNEPWEKIESILESKELAQEVHNHKMNYLAKYRDEIFKQSDLPLELCIINMSYLFPLNAQEISSLHSWGRSSVFGESKGADLRGQEEEKYRSPLPSIEIQLLEDDAPPLNPAILNQLNHDPAIACSPNRESEVFDKIESLGRDVTVAKLSSLGNYLQLYSSQKKLGPTALDRISVHEEKLYVEEVVGRLQFYFGSHPSQRHSSLAEVCAAANLPKVFSPPLSLEELKFKEKELLEEKAKVARGIRLSTWTHSAEHKNEEKAEHKGNNEESVESLRLSMAEIDKNHADLRLEIDFIEAKNQGPALK